MAAKQLHFALLPVLLASALAGKPLEIPTVEIADGVHMPTVSIGTGGREHQDATTIVTNWLALGGRGIDTALMYRNQAAVGAAIRQSGIPREQLFITTKIPGCLQNSSQNVAQDLQLLGVDYVDLMLIHFPRPAENCPATWRVLEEYHAKGKLRAIGVSNFREVHLQAIFDVAKVKPVVNQIEHNVLHHDDATIAFSHQHGIAIEAYSPLGRGDRSADISGNKAIQAIAASHSKSTYQVALRWIVQHGNLLTFQSSSQAHQAADAAIFDFELTASEMATLDGLQPSLAEMLV